MYKEFFLLNEMPFSIVPDPRFLYMSEHHCEAMAHLLYGVQGEGGFVLLTGEVGTGKTTICRSLIDQIPANIEVAFILNPNMTVRELLLTICEELHIEIKSSRPTIKTLIDALNERLLSAHAKDRRVILIIDEAQNLDSKVLEQLRLLTNLETDTRKLLQIFLIGQPELLNLLSRSEMRQVSQRVVARYHLKHLSQLEVNAYVAHRLRIAGASPLIFPENLMTLVNRASGGVPRLINLICDRALLGAYVQRCEQVSKPILRKAIKEIVVAQTKKPRLNIIFSILLLVVLVAAGLLFVRYMDMANTQSKPSSSTVDTRPPIGKVAPYLANGSAIKQNALTAAILRAPGNVSAGENEMLAYQTLFTLYDIHINGQSKDAPCLQAENEGMRCYLGHGGLSDLFQLDQPVLMRLSSESGTRYWATLISLDHQSANLNVAGLEQRVPLSDLANAWYGQFISIYNSPPDYNGKIPLKYRGTSVTWLRHTMESIDGIRDNGSDEYDEALAKRIRQFQLSDGIQPDGLVGPLTLIRLNVRSGNVKLHLVREQKG